MSTNRRPDFEALLHGEQVPALEDLSGLLAAASAPIRDVEGPLPGEEAAVAAFTAARSAPDPTPARRPSMLKTTLAKLATVKIAAIVVATGACGGAAVAAAASTGTLPSPIAKPLGLHHGSHKPGHKPFPHPTVSPTALPAAVPALCRKLEHDRRPGDAWGRDRQYRPLFDQAGPGAKAEKIKAFCDKVLKGQPPVPPVPGTPAPPVSGTPGVKGHLPKFPTTLPTLRPGHPSLPTPTLPTPKLPTHH